MRTSRTARRSALLLILATLLLVSGLSALAPATAATDPSAPPDAASGSTQEPELEEEPGTEPPATEQPDGGETEPSRPSRGAKAGRAAAATAAADGVLNLELTPINLTNGTVITDAANGTNGNRISYRVQYSCTTGACDDTRVQMSPAPPDPNGLLPDGEWILEYATWAPPATGGTISGTDTTGMLVDLGDLPAGTSGTFSVTYSYQGTTGREIPNGSFYPEGFEIGMSAEATSTTAAAVSATASDVTWHIGTPTGPSAGLQSPGGASTFRTDVPVTYQVSVNAGNITAPGSCLSGNADVVAAGSYRIVYHLPPEAVIQSAALGGVIDNVNHTVTWTSGTPGAPSYGARGGFGLDIPAGFNCGGPAVNNNLRPNAADDAFFQTREVVVTYPGSNFPQADPDGCNFTADLTSRVDVDVSYLDTARTLRSGTRTLASKVACTEPFAGLGVDKRIGGGFGNQFTQGDGSLGGTPEVFALNATPPGETDPGNRAWIVNVFNRGNVEATAVVDETDLEHPNLKVHQIRAVAYPGAPASWRATVEWVDNTGATGTAVLAHNANLNAQAGRWFVSARTTAAVAAGRILPTDTTQTTVQVVYQFRVDDSAPIGETVTNTAPVRLDYPADADGDGAPDDYDDLQGNPLPSRSVAADVVRTARYTRPAPSLVTLTGAPVVAGGGNPKVGTEVTYTLRARTDNVWPGTQLRPQLVFLAPAGWDIVPGSASFAADGQGETTSAPAGVTFDHTTRVVNGVARAVLVATWPSAVTPSSTLNEHWPTLSVKATPTSAAVPGTSVVAQARAGDASGTWSTAVGTGYTLSAAGFRAFNTGVSDAPDVDSDGNTTESYAATDTAGVIVAATDAIRVVKELCVPDAGAADGCSWVSDPSQMAGVPVDAADVKYRVTIRNTGNTTLRDVVAYDVLPYPGDTGLLASPSPRGSEFDMTLASVESSSPGLTLAYSASTNPVRPEVYPGAPGAVDDWSANAAGTKALRIRVDGDLAANTSRQVVFLAAVAPGASAGEVACNTAAVDSNATLPVEPLPVCVTLAEADLAVTVGTLSPWAVDQPTTVPFTVVNHGPSGDAGATVVLDVPAGLRVDDLTPAGFECAAPGGATAPVAGPTTLTCVPVDGAGGVRTLDVGAPEPLVLAVTPTAVTPTPVCLDVAITGPMYDRVPANNEDDACQPVRPAGAEMGDAPDSYGTTLAAGGPAHAFSDLRLGAGSDVEADGQPTAAADGDDTSGVDDEDGVVFNTDVSVPGRVETVYVTASAAGFLNGWIDFDRDGAFDGGPEQVFTDQAVTSGINRLTYSVPDEPAFSGGQTSARFRLTAAAGQATSPTGSAPNGEVEDYTRSLFDAEGVALSQCPRGSFPTPVGVIQNQSFEDYERTFVNGSLNTINNAEHWYDSHPTGGQYYVFEPAPGFDSGPAATVMPFRAGADGHGFLGGHTSGPGDLGEGATNTLAEPLVAGAAYVGFFSVGAGGHSRNGSGYIRMLGVDDPEVGSLPAVPTDRLTTDNSEQLYDTPVVSPAGAGTRAQWSLSTFRFRPDESWNHLRLEARNANPAANGTVGGQTWMSFDDFHLYLCDPNSDFGDAPDSFGTVGASDGATHAVPSYDVAERAAPLMLGSSIDLEGDVTGSPAADADDTTGADDEDAAVAPSLAAGSSSQSLDVAVTNSTGATAVLHGWVDADASGTFQSGEHASVAVPDGATSGTLTWAGLPGLAEGVQPHVRLRLTTGSLTDDSSTPFDERSRGGAPDGEVEDHRATVGAAVPTSCSTPFVEDFGTGPNYGPELPAGQTTYGYSSSGLIVDGNYGIMSQLPGAAGSWWLPGQDHTPGDTDGRMMLINAAVAPGRFFTKTFTGLGAGTEYDFSAWITNANIGNPILPDVTFRVVDPGTGTVLSSVDTGPMPRVNPLTWKQFSLKFTATQPNARLELVNNAPGGSGNDLAIDDIALNLTCDAGDAPDSYGTLLASNGPVHAPAGPRLGADRDGEGDGRPTVGADGDDTAGADDEDGVTFNSALGYPNPTIRTGPDPITLEPVSNTLQVTASEDGFASVWVDWNLDGDFADDGERVADAEPVTAGENDIAFSRLANPDDIRTYVRVRFSSDAAAIRTPTGPAPDGEVEDYRVLLERLITPAACSPVSDPYYAMTFRSVIDKTGAGAPGTSARYPDVSVVGGEPVDMIARTGSPGNTINSNGFFVGGDDAAWNLNAGGGAVGITFSWVRAGTTTPVAMNSIWTINDMDGGERTDFIPPELVSGYALTPGSKVSASVEGGRLLFRGSGSNNGDPASRYQVWFQDKTSVTALWRGFGNSGFLVDGDGDIDVPKSCDDYGDAPNTYGTLLAADGPRHTVTPSLRLGADSEFDADGQPGPLADGDDTNRTDDEDGVADPITLTTGDPTSVEVAVTNTTGGPATLAGWIDLDGDGVFEPGERVVVPVTTQGTSTQQLSFPAGTTAAATYARFRLFPGEVTDPAPTGPASAGEVEDHPVTVLDRSLVVTKTSDATGDARPGDVVTYTVTATNTGDGAYTEANPARVVDDLTAVLDDAAFDGTATATVDGEPAGAVSFSSPRLLWTGPLAPGESVEVSYTVTLEGGGDGTVRNVAWAPPVGTPPGPTPDCDDPATTVPCAGTETLLPQLRVTKTSSRDALPAVGGEVTYTVTVRNEGPGVFSAAEPATFADDLSDVLDDAELVDGSVTGGAEVDGDELTWSGPLGVDESATVAYTVRYTAAGNRSLTNAACVPAEVAVDPQDPCARTVTPGSGLDQAKTANPASGSAVDAGAEIAYTLRFSNTGQTAASVDTVDDLSGVLDDADLLVDSLQADGPLTATYDAAGGHVVVGGSVPVGETLFVRYTVRVQSFADQGDHLLRNALACQPGDPATCEPEVTEHPVRSLGVKKTSDATADARPGDVVTYTVRVQNTGSGAYTVEEPAVVADALSDVLDDAVWDGTATATVDGDPAGTLAFNDPRLVWTGALAAGDVVIIQYSVTLQGGGDGAVRNTAFAPPCDPAAPGCNPPTPGCEDGADPDTGLACDVVETLLPKLTIAKSVEPEQATAVGDELLYTIRLHNPGPGDYSAEAPATVTDDLSDVLDDATVVDGSLSGGAEIDGDQLTWSGALPAFGEEFITYTVRYTGAGDRLLGNTACVPADEVAAGELRCASTETPGSALVPSKTASPVDGAPVEAGDEVTYTLTFDNSAGQAPAVVDTHDDLTEVLDDAELTAGPTAEDGLSADLSPATDQLAVTGEVPAGETRTVTYVVTVLPFADQGDHVLRNRLACQPGEPASCEPEVTEHPVRHLRVEKSSDVSTGVDTGDEVTYSVTVHNDGAGDYTSADPASVVDDLSDVVDDAVLGGITATSGSASYAAPELTWTGALAADESVTISYTVSVTNLGDHDLVNTVIGVGCDDGDAGCAPEPVVTLLPHVVPGKSAVPASGSDLGEGDEVVYTLSWTNDGQAAGVVDGTDDLSGVLDDTELVEGPTSSTASVTATVTGDELRVTGPIAVGQTVTVTYRVRVLPDGERGDNRLGNVLAADTPQVDCEPGQAGVPVCTPVEPPTTEHLVGELDDWKTVTPRSGSMVQAGDRVTYTLHFTNTGTAPVEVDRHDVLTGVLDDAVLLAGPRASDPALTVSGPANRRITIAGTLAVDQTVTVTYVVRVKPANRQGDHRLGNFLVDAGEQLPASCSVPMPRAQQGPAGTRDCTTNPVRRFDARLDKRAVSGPRATVGDRIRYRLSVANRGPDAAPGPVRVVDRLPRGLELVSAKGRGWRCTVRRAADVATCVRTAAIGPRRTTAPITLVATATRAAVGRKVVNTARIDGVTDANTANNGDTAGVRVSNVPPPPSTGFRLRRWVRGAM